MRPTLGIRLLLAYNALFSWRRRQESENGWATHDWDDDAASVAYAKWRQSVTPEFLASFPPVDFRGKTVLDFGCGHGGSSVYFAEQGAEKVIGVDIGEAQMRFAKQFLAHVSPDGSLPVDIRLGSHDRTPVDDASIDLLMSRDVVEHVQEPEQVLREWHRMLKPDGRAYVTFGPLWYHPHGVHLWEIFPAPWTHVLFPEKTVVRARHYLKRDGVDPEVISRYRDLGFNRMTVSRFLRLLKRSGFVADLLHCSPMMKFAPLVWLPVVREFFTTEIQCVLRKA